jgi:hypothetical protein
VALSVGGVLANGAAVAPAFWVTLVGEVPQATQVSSRPRPTARRAAGIT